MSFETKLKTISPAAKKQMETNGRWLLTEYGNQHYIKNSIFCYSATNCHRNKVKKENNKQIDRHKLNK